MHRIRLLATMVMLSLMCALAPVLTAGAASAAPSTFDLVNYVSHYCLGITGGASDAAAIQWACTESADQTWHWGSQYGTSGYDQLINNNNQCLSIAGSSTAEGADVVTAACNLHRLDQYWSTIYYGGGYSWFVNYNSGQVIGVLGGSTAQGAAIVQWVWQDSPNH